VGQEGKVKRRGFRGSDGCPIAALWYPHAFHQDLVVELARFASLEQFWATFRWLKPVKDLARDSSYHVFRRSVKPMWENFIHGGCIIVKLKKNGEGIDAYWQTLVAAAIGEYFEEPQIVGVGVGLRSKETCLSVWVATESMRVRTRLTEMINRLLKVAAARASFSAFSDRPSRRCR
jgi:translation initiation factor 4E